MKTVFISYDHDDQSAKRDIDSIRLNSNNLIKFNDGSLLEPVYNDYGHVIRRMPNDDASRNVCYEIKKLLEKSSKLLVLIGKDTHSSKWVQWEIDTFKSIKVKPDILFMRIKNDSCSGLPNNARDYDIKEWDLLELINWLR